MDESNEVSSDVVLDASDTYYGVILDDVQYDELMSVLTAQTQMGLFQFAFVVLIFGVLLGTCLFKFWRV